MYIYIYIYIYMYACRLSPQGGARGQARGLSGARESERPIIIISSSSSSIVTIVVVILSSL